MTEFSLSALKAEIEADPEGLGYKNPDTSWKGDQAIADLLNALTGPGVANILRKLIQPKEIWESIDIDEWVVIPEAQRQYVSMITKGELVNAEETPVFDALNSIFNNTDAPTTRTSILAKIQRDGSRAEVLWGDGITITAGQVGHAFNEA